MMKDLNEPIILLINNNLEHQKINTNYFTLTDDKMEISFIDIIIKKILSLDIKILFITGNINIYCLNKLNDVSCYMNSRITLSFFQT